MHSQKIINYFLPLIRFLSQQWNETYVVGKEEFSLQQINF